MNFYNYMEMFYFIIILEILLKHLNYLLYYINIQNLIELFDLKIYLKTPPSQKDV